MPSDYLLTLDGVPGESASVGGTFPIADLTRFSAAQLDRCTTGNALTVCDGLSFETTSFPVYDAINFNFINLRDGTPGAISYLFAEGSFDGFGTSTSIDGLATLTISAVPEAATWLMLIVGFGVLGTMLRRRRRLAAA
jgi:hypothetical protein